jgi:hypothetical protein
MSPRIVIHDASGLTLIETLVAVLVGVVVTGATFAILNLSLNQSTRIADRVSADQRGRLAMEKLLLELHSSCVSIGQNPILEGSTPTKIEFVSQSGSEAAFTTVTKHEVKLENNALTDTYYTSNESATHTEWKWTTPATKTVTLLTGVSQSGTAPVFQYFKYENGQLSATPLSETELTKRGAETATQVNIRFSVAPESGNNKGDRLIDLSDSVVLRLTPPTEVGPNEPCE